MADFVPMTQYYGERRMAKGMGFNAAVKSVMRHQGYGKARAARIIAAGARNASAAAKRRNPNLKKVSGA